MIAAQLPDRQASPWLRSAVAHALATVAAEPALRACAHIDTLPCVLTIWDQRLRCLSCTAEHLRTLRLLDTAEDHTCDRCRDLAETVDTLVIYLGDLHLVVGLCSTCLSLEGVRRHAAR